MTLRRFAVTTLMAAMALAATPAGAQDGLPMPNPAIASMTPDQLVETREAAMRENGGLLRSAGNLTGEAAVAAANTILQHFVDFEPLFDQRSQTALNNSALPIVWEDWAGFVALLETGQQAALTMRTAAEAGDAAGYTGAIQTIGGLCGQCHGKYRM
jgi:cytochrome c556